MPVTKGRPQPEPAPEPAPGAVPDGDFQPVAYEGQVAGGDAAPVADESSDQVTDETLKSNEEVAKEVIAGHWGRGNRRKERLQNAGYDLVGVSEAVDKALNQNS